MRKIRENKYESNVDVHKWEIYFTRESEKKRYILNKNGRLYYETSCRHSLYSFSCLDDLNLGLFSSFLLLASLAISSGFVRLALRARTRAREKERERETLVFFLFLLSFVFALFLLRIAVSFLLLLRLSPTAFLYSLYPSSGMSLYLFLIVFLLQLSICVSLTSCKISRIRVLFFMIINSLKFNFHKNIYILFYDKIK